MDTDVKAIYERLHDRYPIILSSSLTLGFKFDFPVLHGQSSLGTFELFYDGVSFPFYAKDDTEKVYAHFHLQTPAKAEETVIEFMEGKLTIVQFRLPSGI